MTVIFSKKCEYGMQAILYLAAREKGTLVSADEISKVLKIPREFVSKILQSLRDSGLISSSKGKSGGFSLAKPASRIKLIDVVAAIDGLEMFDSCVLGFQECSPTHLLLRLTDSRCSTVVCSAFRNVHRRILVPFTIPGVHCAHKLTICSLQKRLIN